MNDTLRAMIQAAHTYDLLHYDVHVSLDPTERTGRARCAVRLAGTRTPAPAAVEFILHRSVKILAITEDGRPLTHRSVAPFGGYAGVLVTVNLERPLAQGEERTLVFETSWTSKPNEPRVAHAPYVGAAEAFTDLASAWFPGLLYDTFTYDLTVECPAWMTVVANGDPVGCEAKGERQEFRFRSAAPMWVINFVAGKYRRTHRLAGDFTFETLLDEAEPAGAAETILDDIERAFKFCVGQFGPPGINHFTLVQAPNTYDQPSYNGFTYAYLRRPYFPFLGKSVDEGGANWYGPLSHEVAHTWWGYRAMSDILGNGGNWLREGLAEYTSVMALEDRYGTDFADFATRRRLLAGYLEDVRAFSGAEPSLVDVSYLSPQDVSYEKGAYSFLMLRERIGAAAMGEVLHRYLDAVRGRFAGYKDFRKVAEEVHGESLRDFFRAWVVGTARVDLEVVSMDAHEGATGWESEIVVVNRAERAFPVETELSVDGGGGAAAAKLERVTCGPEPATVRVVTPERPRRVELDPRWRVLDVDRSNNSLPRGVDSGLITQYMMRAPKKGDPKNENPANAIGVLWVKEGSALARAGLKAGDVILTIEGAPVTGPDQFARALFHKRAGDDLDLRVSRGAETRRIKCKLE